jgi:hypothetical protein
VAQLEHRMDSADIRKFALPCHFIACMLTFRQTSRVVLPDGVLGQSRDLY